MSKILLDFLKKIHESFYRMIPERIGIFLIKSFVYDK